MSNKVKAGFFISIWCAVFLPGFSYSQPIQLRYENYNIRDGLSANGCEEIFQDSRGFIWIGTVNGLNRFDGNSFQNFYHNPSDSNSLSGNGIRKMTELPGGLLVIATNNGMCVYNIYKNRFENFRIKQKELLSGKNIFIRMVFCDAEKNLWVNYNGNFDVFDSLLNYKFRFTDTPEGKILKGIVAGSEIPVLDEENNLWMPSDNMGLIKIENKTRRVTCYKNSSALPFSQYPIRGFYYDSSKKIIWFSPWGKGLWKYSLPENKLSEYHFPVVNKAFGWDYNVINGIIPVGILLLCGSESGGLYEFNPDDGKIKIHTHDIYNPYSISSDEISKMYADHEDNLWISTSEGLSKTNLKQTPFHFFSEEFRNKSNEPFPSLMSFAVYDSDWLLVGTESKGLFALNRKTGEVKQCINNKPQHEKENVIPRLYIDSEKIWVGTYAGLFFYDIKKNCLTRPDNLFRGLSHASVSAIFRDSHHDYWLGFRDTTNLVHYSAGKNKFTKYYYQEEKAGEKKFPLFYPAKIREDRAGNIWFSTPWSNGFAKWDRATDSITRYPKIKSEDENLSESLIDILPDTGSYVWLASGTGHGLIHYNYLTNESESFSRSEGLCNEILGSITRDRNGNLWLGTHDGLAQFTPSEKKFINFSTADGLPDNEFKSSSYFDAAANLIYMLTPHSIVYFNPEELKEKPSSQNLFIQKIQINGRDTSVDLSQPLQLSYNENYINIEYTSIDFKNGSKVKFYYLLNGLDKNWNEAGSQRFASYSNLAPGDYIFKLKTSIGNNESGKEINAFAFTVLPPFWKTWWFRALLLLFIISCIYWIIVRRVHAIRREEKQKTEFNRQLAEVEMKALRAQMNPHFIFNCLNSINKFILENDTEKASRYLAKFSKLIRMILENSEQPMISLSNELEMLGAYLEMETNRFKTKFDYEIAVDEKINMNGIEIPSMLIQPYVENAIWHGLLPKDGKGELKISIANNENSTGISLLCTIRDNGIGRTKAKELKEKKILSQKSMGMKVTEERMHLLSVGKNKKPEVKITDLFENGMATGTQVELTIPL